ncbi:MAG: alpha/beta hydrolase [Erysipelotrichaceae bacterium]|nr:alpha/beta hydrolase [Erysipelotrichaceae bacterium]
MSRENVERIRREWKEGDTRRDAGLTIPEDIQRFVDLKYGPYDDNLLDVYVPKDTKNQLPAIISIHGGGWVYGDKELYSHYCMRLAQRGFAVVNFTYRLAPEHRYPSALEDCFQVFSWVKEHHDEYYIDDNNLFVLGDSAGGQLTHQCMTILTNPEYRKLFDLKVPEDFKVNACALNCGVYSFGVNRFIKPNDASMMTDYLPENYKDYLKQYAVTKNMTRDFPPAFVMTAYHDFLKFMAKPLYNRLKRLGVEAEYHIYGSKEQKEIGHVFHLNCRSELADRCNDEECEFFRKHLK